jgi:hypothetical protein
LTISTTAKESVHLIGEACMTWTHRKRRMWKVNDGIIGAARED